MKKIVLLCAAGMSTSLLVSHMKDVAKEEGFECEINAYSVGEGSKVIPDSDIVLLGPQVRFQLKPLQKQFPGKLIDTIDMKSYGMMDGKAVLNFAKTKMGV